jgi:hypothetical protein
MEVCKNRQIKCGSVCLWLSRSAHIDRAGTKKPAISIYQVSDEREDWISSEFPLNGKWFQDTVTENRVQFIRLAAMYGITWNITLYDKSLILLLRYILEVIKTDVSPLSLPSLQPIRCINYAIPTSFILWLRSKRIRLWMYAFRKVLNLYIVAHKRNDARKPFKIGSNPWVKSRVTNYFTRFTS